MTTEAVKIAEQIVKLSEKLPKPGKDGFSVVGDYYESTLFAVVTGTSDIESEVDFGNRCVVPSLTKDFALKIKDVFDGGLTLKAAGEQINLLVKENKTILEELNTAKGNMHALEEKFEKTEATNKKLQETNKKLNQESVSSRLVPSGNSVHVIDPDGFVRALARAKEKRDAMLVDLKDVPENELAGSLEHHIVKFINSILEPSVGL